VTDIPASTAPSAATPTTGISTDTSRLTSRANLQRAGEKFESVFINMMLKSMRATKLGGDEGGLFDDKNEKTFRDMSDQKVADSMAQHQPIGIGKALTDFLARSQSQLQDPANVATPPADGSTSS